MNGYRFYLEYDSPRHKRRGEHAGNVIALLTESPVFGDILAGERYYVCISGIFGVPNSPVCLGAVSLEKLRQECKRVSEREARRIHPKLFEHISQLSQGDSYKNVRIILVTPKRRYDVVASRPES